MKKIEDCNNIEDIRACIDEIDKYIIDNLVLRSMYVKCAAKYKKTISDVKAENRVASMLKTRIAWAEEKGIDPDFIQSIFKNVVDYFIKNETSEWQN